MRRKPAIISYDISSHLKRRRVHRRLQQWRIDGQKSVHECLLNEKEAEELYVQLLELIDPDKDRLMLTWLVANSNSNLKVEGLGAGATDSFFRRLVHVN